MNFSGISEDSSNDRIFEKHLLTGYNIGYRPTHQKFIEVAKGN